MRRRRQTLLWGATAMLAVRVAWAVATWEPGWSALSWDDFARVEMAQAWAADPSLSPDLVWLPVPFWVYGTAFILFGGFFSTDPMALVAIVNTMAILATAVMVGLTSRTVFDSDIGGLIAFGAVLFSPWGFFTSLSGLSEPLYYLMIATVGWFYVDWLKRRRLTRLLVGGMAVAVAAAIRYEAWWLAVAWWLSIAVPEGWKLFRRERPAFLPVLVAAVPAVTPLAWFALNAARTGDPLHFVTREAQAYAGGYGTDLFDSALERLTFYPLALLRSDPLLLALAALVFARLFRNRTVTRLARLFALTFLGWYTSTLLAPPVGIFSERYMFAFAVGVAPLLGGLPAVLASIPSDRRRRLLTVACLVSAVAVSGYRIADRPVEWTHPPDLLALNDALGMAARTHGPLSVRVGPGMEIDLTPMRVQNGSNVRVEPGDPAVTPGEVPPGIDLWIERLPERVQGTTAGAVIGRYRLYGPGVEILGGFTPMPGGDGWVYHDEGGQTSPIPPGSYVGLEFAGEDPPPGSEAFVSRSIERGAGELEGSVEFRSMYGHGYNTGRITVLVRLDGVIVHRHDIADPSRWIEVRFVVPAGTGTSTIDVVVIAEPEIESGWGWGRASTVLVRSLLVDQP